MAARFPEYAVNIAITLLVAILAGLAVGAALGFPHLGEVFAHHTVSVSAPNPLSVLP
jgi:hypothetical protein